MNWIRTFRVSQVACLISSNELVYKPRTHLRVEIVQNSRINSLQLTCRVSEAAKAVEEGESEEGYKAVIARPKEKNPHYAPPDPHGSILSRGSHRGKALFSPYHVIVVGILSFLSNRFRFPVDGRLFHRLRFSKIEQGSYLSFVRYRTRLAEYRNSVAKCKSETWIKSNETIDR